MILDHFSAVLKVMILPSAWASMNWLAIVGVDDVVSSTARIERLSIIGILVLGLIALGVGLNLLYRANVTAMKAAAEASSAAAKASADQWKEHHSATVTAMTDERKTRNAERAEEYKAMISVLTSNAVAMTAQAKSVESLEMAVRSLESIVHRVTNSR